MEYNCLFGYAHPPATELAEAVAARTPGDLNHGFFCNSGSEAVETALKIARAYWRRLGQGTKTGFVSLHRGYHGMNFGGVSVGGMRVNRTPFGPLLPGCTQVRAHDVGALERELRYRDPKHDRGGDHGARTGRRGHPSPSGATISPRSGRCVTATTCFWCSTRWSAASGASATGSAGTATESCPTS